MARGYAEGPATEEHARRLEEREHVRDDVRSDERVAVYGSTADETERHFLGWLGDVDPDQLFAQGEAWGLTMVRRRTRA